MNDAADGVAPVGDAPSFGSESPSSSFSQAPVESPAQGEPLCAEASSADEAPPVPPSAAPAAQPESAERTDEPKEPTVVVRYGLLKHVGQFRCTVQPLPRRGEKAVIRTERGVELGEVIAPVCGHEAEGACAGGCLSTDKLEAFLVTNGRDYPFGRGGRVLRGASPQDVNDQEHLDRTGGEQLAFCKQQAAELKLPMRPVAVENLLGGERIIFYFTSETRVDFRELVRRLAQQYRTRIEMRQVGARDEARLVGDYERCGQRCCCQQFVKSLQPVSIRMAKTQKATLDPSKISGRCGRLMCCLRYEDAGYEQLKSLLPRKNTFIRTAELVGKVLETQILTQLVRVLAADGSVQVVANEDIIETNVTPPAPGQTPPPSARPTRSERPRPAAAAAPAAAPAETADAETDEEPSASADPGQPDAASSKKRRRRRRRKGVPGEGQAQGQEPRPAQQAAPSSAPAGEGQASDKKKRRRRRRRKSGPPQGGAPQPPAE